MITRDPPARTYDENRKSGQIAEETGPLAGRVPLLPVDTLDQLLAVQDPVEAIRTFLRGSELARRAIFVGSPSLGAAIEQWIEGGSLRSDALPLRALAYLIRMASRPTPYGLFAGIGIAEVGPDTTLALELGSRQTRTRPDMMVLAALKESVESGARRGDVRYVANDAIVKKGGRLYVAHVLLTSSAGNFTEQRSVSLRDIPVVSYLRRVARSLVTYDSLVATVCAEFGCSNDEARRTLDALITAGLLVSELQASPVGDPIPYTIARLAAIDPTLAASLEEAVGALKRLDADTIEHQSIEAYSNAANAFAALTGNAQDPVLQVDMRVPFTGHLKAAVLEDARQLLEYLIRMGWTGTLKRYHERFVERYEGIERMVPLLELVDPNIGLGSPGTLEVINERNPKRDALLAYIAADAARRGCTEVELTREQLDIIAPTRTNEPGRTFELSFQIAAESRSALDRGEYLVVPSGFVGTIGRWRSLGRFLDLFPASVVEQMRVRDVDDGPLRAELNYPPAESRMYNVSIRPSVVDSEIRIGIGEPSRIKQLALGDLWVGIDNGVFFLWSATLCRRVEPIETHKFNSAGLSPNLCQFLSLLASDGVRGFGNVWAGAASFTALPRIRHGRVVLSPQQWRFPRSEFGSSVESMSASLQRIRKAWSLPRHVVMGFSDNLLALDLDSPIVGRLLHDQLSPSDDVVQLQEMLPSPSQAWLTADSNKYMIEFATTFENVGGTSSTTPRTRRKPIVIPERRRYGPGSQWTYAKIYTGSQAIDNVLISAVAPLIVELRSANFLKTWFFVRYGDPNTHLRLRMRAIDGQRCEIERRVVDVFQRLLDTAEISRFALDTYEPEYERYGGIDQMSLVEDFFQLDSDACLRALPRAGGTSDQQVAVAVEIFLKCLGTDNDLHELVKRAFAVLPREKMSPSDRSAFKTLTTRHEWMDGQSVSLRNALNGDDLEERLRSIFHMHCNRLGLNQSAERRAAALLRSVALAHIARIKAIDNLD